MAGVTSFDDLRNGRFAAMWSECGIQFRSNTLAEIGGQIPLHVHGYDHIALITHGLFNVREVLPTGEVKEYQMASKDFDLGLNYRVLIPAGHQHTFTLVQCFNQPGEVLCMWGVEE
jgi:hypothetical protein